MPPPRRPLGQSGLSVAPFALGGNVFGWTLGEEEGYRVLDAFVNAGFNLIDTADVYSNWVDGHRGGESEAMIGRWLRTSGRRDEVLLATKVGMDMGSEGQGLSPEHIARSAQASLRRLGVDRIDLYQAHRDDPATPLEETLRAFDALMRAGQVRALGASNYSGDRLRQALRASERSGLPRFECVQPRYNLMDREEYETSLRDVCAANNLGVITYSSLASGFLSGKYRSTADLGKSPRGERARARLTDRGQRILEALDRVAKRLDTTPSAAALAWLIAQPTVTAPIASVTSTNQLAELLRAADLRLDAESLKSLELASAEPPG